MIIQEEQTERRGGINFIWVGIGFSLVYWILESVRDVLAFDRGTLIERLFFPDFMTFWMRMLVVFLLILFSCYAHYLRHRVFRRKTEDRPVGKIEIIKVGAVVGIVYSVIESVRDVLIFEKGTLFERVFYPDAMSIWMRLLAICVLVLFSVYAQNLVNERKRAEEELRHEREALEKEVERRTAELTESNRLLTLLKKEIAQRERMETALRASEAKYRTIVENTGTAIIITDENHLISLVNHEFEAISGYRRQEVQGVKRWKDFIVDEDLEKMEAYARDRRNDPDSAPKRYEFRFKHKDGSIRNGLVNVALIQGTKRSIASLLDITDVKCAEAEKEKMQSQLMQAKKMEAIGILAGGVAHDFNNLMTAIIGSADMSMMDIKESDPVFSDLKEIRSAAVRAADLTAQLLLFSRKKPMKRTLCSMNGIVGDLLKMLRRLIGEDIEIRTQFNADLWNVRADKGTIGQVVMNLAVNARDAMPDGGRLLIQTDNVVLSDEDVQRMPEARAGTFVRLTVADTGCGIEKEKLQHIFDPFYSTKDVGKGTGLGLSVVYGIIEQHNGWIHVTSVPGSGTSFETYLEAVFEEVDTETTFIQPENVRKGDGKRILLVEDEDRVREFVTNGLNRNGYMVFTAADAKEAETVFKEEHGNFDVLLTDVVLPGKNGLELADQFLSENPELPIILSSGYTDSKVRWPVIQERGYRFLEKPYDLNGLLRIVGEMAALI